MSNQNSPSPIVLIASAIVTLIGMAPTFINIMVRRAHEAKSKKPDVKADVPAPKAAQDIEQQLPQGRLRNQLGNIAADVRLGREIASDNKAAETAEPKAEAPNAKKPVGKKLVGKKSLGKKAGKPETPQP